MVQTAPNIDLASIAEMQILDLYAAYKNGTEVTRWNCQVHSLSLIFKRQVDVSPDY